MKIIIKETGETKELKLTDNNGVDYTVDFVANNTASYEANEDGIMIMTQEEFEWWKPVVEKQQELEDLIIELREDHEYENIIEVVDENSNQDLEYQAENVINALKAKFCSEPAQMKREKMSTFTEIENKINLVKQYNQEAGNTLHDQLSHAANAQWTSQELADYLKSDNDVAEEFYNEGEVQHSEIRNIQDWIIGFFGEDDELVNA